MQAFLINSEQSEVYAPRMMIIGKLKNGKLKIFINVKILRF